MAACAGGGGGRRAGGIWRRHGPVHPNGPRLDEPGPAAGTWLLHVTNYFYTLKANEAVLRLRRRLPVLSADPLPQWHAGTTDEATASYRGRDLPPNLNSTPWLYRHGSAHR